MDSSKRPNVDEPGNPNVLKETKDIKLTSLILFCTQCFVIIAIVLASLYNLTFGTKNQLLWTAVLTGFSGYLMPNPKLKFDTEVFTHLRQIHSIKDIQEQQNREQREQALQIST